MPWRRKWQPTPAFLPGESHGQKNMVGYSPWGCKDSNTTEHTCTRGAKEYPAGPQQRTKEQQRGTRWARLGRAVKQDAGGNAQQFDLHFKTSWISRKVSNKYDGLIM